jgi:multidrug efflux pump
LPSNSRDDAVFSRFFIDRPIFAAVLSIVITLAGGMAVFTLPLAQFPRISPPTVTVQATYPGASAKDVAEAVAAPIEQQVNGVEGMMYMSSSCTNDGSYNLTVTFYQGIDLNMAQVLVQNRVNLALPMLPDVIKASGVTTLKRSPDILGGLAITSPGGRYDQLYLSNYALRMIKDELARVPGVADVFLFGQRDYSMRIWVDPDKLTGHGMTAGDVIRAIREQNNQLATGRIGQQPTRAGQQLEITLDTLGRLKDVQQFEQIVIRATRDGRIVRLKDVARVVLGAKNEDVSVRMDGKPTVFLAIFQLPDANALDTAEAVLAKMDELKKSFPDDVSYDIGFDTTPYTRESIKEVFKTLRDAIILVAVVVLLFLQNWRSAVIPLVAVPVAIIGTFAVMAALGFSLNNLTLFGLVLAIGIVVDDAIVVVESVEHHIEHGMTPRAATIKAMEQVSGPVVAVGLVLSAVFVPCAFISGITGMFFRQFALTISASTIISAFNSLTLSPALTALLLRPRHTGAAPPLPRLGFLVAGGAAGYFFLAPALEARLAGWAAYLADDAADWLERVPSWLVAALAAALCAGAGWSAGRFLNFLLSRFFQAFNRGFVWATGMYTWLVGRILRVSAVVLAVYVGFLALTYFVYQGTPRGFIPSQDMGYLMINVQLPDAASMERTEEVMGHMSRIAQAVPGIRHVTAIAGQSFVLSAYGSNFGSMFVNLKEYKDRRDPSRSSDVIAATLRKRFEEEIFDAQVAVFPPPPVRGVGRAGGFALMIEDRGDLGPLMLQEHVKHLVDEGYKQQDPKNGPKLVGLFSVFRANVPQLHIEPDRRECLSKGVSLGDFAETLRTYQGSLYINDFNLFGRTWQVIMQSDARFRDRKEELKRLAVRSDKGYMVPLGSLADESEVNGPLILTRYNMYPAATINGMAGKGMSSGQAIDLLKQLADRELPSAMAYEWTDMSFLELQAGNTAMVIFAFAVVMVFLVLAAQYESWSLPLAVILVVPMCLLSAIIGVRVAHMDINIFTEIGFVVLVGLASKNAILIVEFAKKEREAGAERHKATLDACRLRLRPIIMTSFAFILGVLPLIWSHGAGAEMRHPLGTAVFSGMLGVTLFGIFLTPVFFFVINWLGDSRVLASGVAVRLGELPFRIVRRTRALARDLWRSRPPLTRPRIGTREPFSTATKANGTAPRDVGKRPQDPVAASAHESASQQAENVADASFN